MRIEALILAVIAAIVCFSCGIFNFFNENYVGGIICWLLSFVNLFNIFTLL